MNSRSHSDVKRFITPISFRKRPPLAFLIKYLSFPNASALTSMRRSGTRPYDCRPSQAVVFDVFISNVVAFKEPQLKLKTNFLPSPRPEILYESLTKVNEVYGTMMCTRNKFEINISFRLFPFGRFRRLAFINPRQTL